MLRLRAPLVSRALAAMSTAAKQAGPVEQSILRKIENAMSPVSLSIINDSHKHAGHSGNPTGAADAETHFRVEVVSEAFQGKALVQRHRMVYDVLGEEFTAGLHALSLKTKTPSEVGGK